MKITVRTLPRDLPKEGGSKNKNKTVSGRARIIRLEMPKDAFHHQDRRVPVDCNPKTKLETSNAFHKVANHGKRLGLLRCKREMARASSISQAGLATVFSYGTDFIHTHASRVYR